MSFQYNVSLYRTICLIVLACIGCRNTSSQISRVEAPPKQLILTREPLQVPTDSTTKYFNGLRKKASVVNYYQRFGSDFIWTKKNEPTAFADSMVLLIRDALYYGFYPERYHINELIIPDKNSSDDVLIRNELLMTDAFLCFVTDLKFGLFESNKSDEVDSIQVDLLNKFILHGNLKEILRSQEPVFKGYESLKQGIALILDSLKTTGHDSADVADRIRLISINLERWRTENADLSQRHIFINIPSYTLDVMEHDSSILSSRIIVGLPDKETPIISSVVECFTIYPYWHVPRKIAIEEFLPVIKNDVAFIERNHFDVLDRKGKVLDPDSVEWNKFHKNYFPVVLRQREGAENALGVIKFIFDNPHAVYLHDTNAKRLFRNKERALSHGCIRMERAVELAHYLVTERIGSESKTITKYLREEQQRWVDLKRPIPIYTRYFTSEFKNGRLYTYKDVYRKDKPLYDLLHYDLSAFDL
jgi:murein L,D-transpeptidase YcbB/YkuD